MASTCGWFPYPDSACLVLGCVRVCVLPQRLSKGKCIGSILDDRGRLRDAFYFNRQKSHPQRLACAWPLLSPEAARALVKRMRLPRRRPTTLMAEPLRAMANPGSQGSSRPARRLTGGSASAAVLASDGVG